MPANLTVNQDGQAEMFYAWEAPWHKMGTRVEHALTSEEAITAANMDWNVITSPILYTSPSSGVLQEVPHRVAVIREDTDEVFTVASDRYTPLPNRNTFDFFDNVVGAGQAIYHTAGTINGGRKLWILAKLDGELHVTNDDVLHKYILLGSSHDSTMPLSMMFTTVRVVCDNTFSLALKLNSQEQGIKFTAKHTPNIAQKAVNARETLDLADAYFENMMVGVNSLVQQEWDSTDMKRFAYTLFDLDVEKSIDEQRKNKSYAADKVIDLFSNGRGNGTNTKWDAFNAITEYADYNRPVGHKVETGDINTLAVVDKRLNDAWYGPGAALKQRAWDLLTIR